MLLRSLPVIALALLVVVSVSAQDDASSLDPEVAPVSQSSEDLAAAASQDPSCVPAPPMLPSDVPPAAPDGAVTPDEIVVQAQALWQDAPTESATSSEEQPADVPPGETAVDTETEAVEPQQILALPVCEQAPVEAVAPPTATPTPTPVPPTPTPVPPVAPPADVPVGHPPEALVPSPTETIVPNGTSTPTSTMTVRPSLTPTVTPTRTGQPTPTSVLSFSGSGFAPPSFSGPGFSGPGSSGPGFGGPGLGGGGLSPGNPTASPTPQPTGPVGGVWSGTTNQGRAISFTVDGTDVRSISAGWSTGGCAPMSGQLDAQGPFAIANNHVSAMGGVPGGGIGFVLVNIDFDSTTSATGTIGVTVIGSIDISAPQSGCSTSSPPIPFRVTAAARP